MKTAAVALALVGAVTAADQTVKFEFNGGALEASLIGHTNGDLEFVTPAGGCVYRGNWCGDWLDTACVIDPSQQKHTGINFSRGGARAVLYENGVLAFESDNGCVHIEETAAPDGGWTPIAGNKGQLGFASGDVDTKEVHSRIHVKPNGELWISAKNLLDMVPPTSAPTEYPTAAPTDAPTKAPTAYPTASPTEAPTKCPCMNFKVVHDSVFVITNFKLCNGNVLPTKILQCNSVICHSTFEGHSSNSQSGLIPQGCATSAAPTEYPTASPTDAPTVTTTSPGPGFSCTQSQHCNSDQDCANLDYNQYDPSNQGPWTCDVQTYGSGSSGQGDGDCRHHLC